MKSTGEEHSIEIDESERQVQFTVIPYLSALPLYKQLHKTKNNNLIYFNASLHISQTRNGSIRGMTAYLNEWR